MRLLTLKRADDGDGYIIRLKNTNTILTQVTIETRFELNSAYTTDLLEGNIECLSVDPNRMTFSIVSSAIKTIRVILIPQGTAGQPEISWLRIFPNPALGEVHFSSELSRSIEINIFGLEGRLIRSLSGENPRWLLNDNQGREIPSGIYFYRAKTGLIEKTGKVVIIGRR